MAANISSNECEVGVNQPKEEEKINGSDDSTCTLKVEIKKEVCEVSVEPSTNKELKEVIVDRSGLESKDMLMNLNMKGVTTTVKGTGCASNGITATKEATLEGWSEVLEASIIGPGAPFSVYLLEPNAFVSFKKKAFITVRWENNPLEATPEEALSAREECGPVPPLPCVGQGHALETCQRRDCGLRVPAMPQAPNDAQTPSCGAPSCSPA